LLENCKKEKTENLKFDIWGPHSHTDKKSNTHGFCPTPLGTSG
jgi:hypothetical protein